MTLETILEAGKNDNISQRHLSAFNKDPASYNAVANLLGDLNLHKEPIFEDLYDSSRTMTPIQQREYAGGTAREYQGALIESVARDLGVALNGFKEGKNLAGYLLNSPISPEKHSFADESLQKKYESAYNGQRFIDAVHKGDQKTLIRIASLWLNDELKRLSEDKSKSIPKILLGAIEEMYSGNPQLLINRASLVYSSNVESFVKDLDYDEGKKYLEGRYSKLEDKEKPVEALSIGRTLFEINKG